VVENQEVGKEEKAALQRLLKMEGWTILLGHWDRLCRTKEKVKSEALRKFDDNKALYLQGFVDGMCLFRPEIEKLAHENGEEKDNPSY